MRFSPPSLVSLAPNAPAPAKKSVCANDSMCDIWLHSFKLPSAILFNGRNTFQLIYRYYLDRWMRLTQRLIYIFFDCKRVRSRILLFSAALLLLVQFFPILNQAYFRFSIARCSMNALIWFRKVNVCWGSPWPAIYNVCVCLGDAQSLRANKFPENAYSVNERTHFSDFSLSRSQF